MQHSLPPLDYDYSALAPHISEETMRLHHSKHHQTYVSNLNNFVANDSSLADASLDEIVQSCAHGPVFNNAGQHWNHCLFWKVLSPQGGGEPDGELASAIKQSFDSFANFQAKFEQCGIGTFGSGWAWLVQNKQGALELMSTSNADNPLRHGHNALLGVDVWEHAYYVDYRNRRPDYLKSIWNLINWKYVASRLK